MNIIRYNKVSREQAGLYTGMVHRAYENVYTSQQLAFTVNWKDPKYYYFIYAVLTDLPELDPSKMHKVEHMKMKLYGMFKDYFPKNIHHHSATNVFELIMDDLQDFKRIDIPQLKIISITKYKKRFLNIFERMSLAKKAGTFKPIFSKVVEGDPLTSFIPMYDGSELVNDVIYNIKNCLTDHNMYERNLFANNWENAFHVEPGWWYNHFDRICQDGDWLQRIWDLNEKQFGNVELVGELYRK